MHHILLQNAKVHDWDHSLLEPGNTDNLHQTKHIKSVNTAEDTKMKSRIPDQNRLVVSQSEPEYQVKLKKGLKVTLT